MNHDEIFVLIEARKVGMHRTIRGTSVKIGSLACKKDIEARIEDIRHNRDQSNHGSDARSYYSGILRVLRRKLRENEKILLSQESTSKEIFENFEMKNEKISSRLLKLSGIL